MISGPPREPVDMPSALRPFVLEKPYEFVWRNELGGLTLRVGEPATCVYVKWTPVHSGVDLDAEVERLSWAAPFTPVPLVLDVGSDAQGSWLVTRGINGENAVSPKWLQDPRTATTALGNGLRALHDAFDVGSCPFNWSANSRLQSVERRVKDGLISDHEFPLEFAGMTISAALLELRVVPAEDLVVCHGDACAPNTLLNESGDWIAHVDFDRLGVGDRWADLSIAAWSSVWNYGPGWEQNVYDAYGYEPDSAKIRYYRLLWDLE